MLLALIMKRSISPGVAYAFADHIFLGCCSEGHGSQVTHPICSTVMMSLDFSLYWVYIQVRLTEGFPADPEYDSQDDTVRITTGGLFPNTAGAAKKLPAPVVPADIKLAVASFKPYFDPAYFPKVRNSSVAGTV